MTLMVGNASGAGGSGRRTGDRRLPLGHTCGVAGNTLPCPMFVPKTCGNSATAHAERCVDSDVDRVSSLLSGSRPHWQSAELYYAIFSRYAAGESLSLNYAADRQ